MYIIGIYNATQQQPFGVLRHSRPFHKRLFFYKDFKREFRWCYG